jgi:hypothetical protein
MPDGTTIEAFTLRNAAGIEVRAITYGGIITSLRVPDRDGRFEDVALGYDTLDGYLKNNSPYFGGIIGDCDFCCRHSPQLCTDKPGVPCWRDVRRWARSQETWALHPTVPPPAKT